jgi:hypothetical protein
MLDLPGRRQWDENFGYCGEVSLITAGLYFGQYLSQYDARAIASQNKTQTSSSSQLLLGVNDVYAAGQMQLEATAWPTTQSTAQFLQWIKQHIASGHPVAIGVFMNETLFGRGATDPDYDHIVPVTGVSSTHPLMGSTYDATDVVYFTDNGLWTGPGATSSFAFQAAFGAFQATRSQANSASRAPYALKSSGNYGIAITGVRDTAHVTLPVRVATSVNAEVPIIQGASRPAASPLTLTVTVSGLQPGTQYKLYRYANFAVAPVAGFNASVSQAARSWTVQISTGSTWSTQEQLMSSDLAIYRAVPASAP